MTLETRSLNSFWRTFLERLESLASKYDAKLQFYQDEDGCLSFELLAPSGITHCGRICGDDLQAEIHMFDYGEFYSNTKAPFDVEETASTAIRWLDEKITDLRNGSAFHVVWDKVGKIKAVQFVAAQDGPTPPSLWTRFLRRGQRRRVYAWDKLVEERMF